MELLLSFNNNSSLTIRVVFSDVKNCELIIFLKPKDLYKYEYSSKIVYPLPSTKEKQDLHKKGDFGLTQDLMFKVEKMIYYQFKDVYARSWDLRRRFVVVPKLREFVEQDNKFPTIGKPMFDEDEIQEDDNDIDEDQIQETDKPSRFVVEAENKAIVEDAVPITQGENILDNSRIMKLMTNMGYKKGKGLGRRSEGPPTFVLDIEIRQQNHTYGLGYRSTAWDDFKQKQLRIAKARAKKEDVPFDVPMSPYPRTLNGRFTRAGDVFPFWGFRSPVVIATGWDV